MEYRDVLELKMLSEIEDLDLSPMIQKIEELRNGKYWESKNNRLSKLLDSEYVAQELLLNSIGFNVQIQELIGRIATKISKCSYKEAIRNAADVIQACEDIYYEVIIGEHIMVNSLYMVEPSTYEYIGLRTYAPPMLVEPKEWVNNSEGGYYDTPINCILGSVHNQHNEKQSLDVLNLLQKIEWRLNPTVLSMKQQPNKPFKSVDSHEQFIKFATDASITYEKYKDRSFWLLAQFDKRGRMYYRGYHINIQGNGFQKALMDFAKPMPIEGTL